MNITLTKEDLADEIAVSLAHILATANRRARQLGCDLSQSLVTISEHFEDGGFWRINYGTRNPASQRGGDLIVEVNAETAEVRRVVRGQ
ncbi:MAG: hypothetical protein HYY24_21690 [Verrucomicrobia bacterium]|nr:hypothetical protein [Verrucomicrobiota bacterium]